MPPLPSSSVSLGDCILRTVSEAAAEVTEEIGRKDSSVCLWRDFRGELEKSSKEDETFSFPKCLKNTL